MRTIILAAAALVLPSVAEAQDVGACRRIPDNLERLTCYDRAAEGPSAASRQSAAVPSFTVKVSLSDQARAVMQARNESISVRAWYSGEPNAAVRRRSSDTNDMGQIDLGESLATFSLQSSMSASMGGSGVKVDRLAMVKNREVQVLVNVYSARKTTQNNLLACDIFEDKLSVAAPGPVNIACRLIGEK